MLSVAPGCELDVERGPDWLLVRVRNLGQIDSGSPPLSDCLWRLLEQYFIYRLVLELDEVEVLDSALIEQLIQLYQRIKEHDGVLRLCGLSARNRRVLHTCRLDERLLPYEDRVEAVMGRPHFIRPR
jgi:anti-anti-sigma factor